MYLEVSEDEALVLFELFSRLGEEDDGYSFCEGPAERKAVSRLLGSLEKVLVQPFAENYQELLEAARRRLTE